MATTADFRNGLVIEFKNDLYRVAEFQHVKPGKGGAFVRTKLKNIKTGRVVDETWNSGANITIVPLRHKTMQYLYNSGSEYVFMDTETFEQAELSKEIIAPYLPYLTESMNVELMVRESDDSPIDIDFPVSVVLEVTEAADAARGDTTGSVTKIVKVETGLEVKVPPFIKQGEKIKIDTRSGQYLERAN